MVSTSAPETSRVPVLHYVFDPLCGWCWGAAPLLQATAAQLPGLSLVLHGGGLFAGAARRPITPELRAYVQPHDRRIQALSGQPFGSGYTDGLLREPDAVLDSEPPITAVLAASELGGAHVGLALLERVQRAHYVEGQRIAEPAVLQGLAREQGLDGAAFEATYERLSGAATQAHLRESRALMQAGGVQGFPSLLLQAPDGHLLRLDHSRYYGDPQAWVQALQQTLG